MRHRSAFTALLIASVTVLACPADAKSRGTETVFFGTHGTGPGQGIFSAHFDPATGALTSLGLAAEIERPTWQVASPTRPILYSVSETGNDGKSEASVSAFSIDTNTGKLSLLNKVGSGGGGATHLSLDPRSQTLFVANYGTATVTALPVNADGTLGSLASSQQQAGSGPKPRQKSAHAHSVAIDPSGHYLLSADLGADKVFVYSFNPATRQLTPAPTPSFSAQPGSGPRHIAFAPGGRFVYIDSELSGEVTAYRWNSANGTLGPIQTVPAFSSDYAGEKSAAEIAMSSDGRFLYLSTRNSDQLIVYSTDPSNGRLTEIQRLAAGGKTPWSFSLSPEGNWLLVANEGAGRINVFKVNRRSGKLSATDKSLDVQSPVSVTFSKE
ncbi:lactonase family protein [Sphingomonas oryzagri]|uniref:Lactonase family protein n=1 Tax=Sphingomonas oryzagri TaxID=3042314 RepID=A0ABT6N3G1_9SPHN|nr:lactonase family protein [Sphingomonas oryzagri]MDH7639303.1 lactonase family protein [Sphingomonas oryzagri]